MGVRYYLQPLKESLSRILFWINLQISLLKSLGNTEINQGKMLVIVIENNKTAIVSKESIW